MADYDWAYNDSRTTGAMDFWCQDTDSCDFFEKEEPKVKVIVEVTVEGKLK